MSIGVYNGAIPGTANGLYEGVLSGTAIGVVTNYDKPGTIIKDSNLLVYYDAGNIVSYPRTGTTWTNLASATLNATLVNGPTFDPNNRCLVFNGSNQYATVASTAFNRTTGQEVTACAWINPTRNAGFYQNIVVNRSNTLYNWMLYQHGDGGEISFHGAAQNKSTYVPKLNTWTHIAATVTSAGVMTIYGNGLPKYRVANYTYNLQAPGSLFIAVARSSVVEQFKGGIGTVAVYNRALSGPEIMTNFIAEKNRFGLL